MSADVIIPCKALHRGKSRLGAVLSDSQRVDLCRQFLVRTVDLASGISHRGRVAVVSDDPEVAHIARRHGIRHIEAEAIDLNADIHQARTILGRPSDALPLLVLPIDLPLASADDLSAVMASPAEVCIVPDLARDGTNVLCLAPSARDDFGFRYGPGSFACHVHAVRASGRTLSILSIPNLMFDVDRPEDLSSIAGLGPEVQTAWRDRRAQIG